MRINTITCHRVYNHGASLQAWALASFLKQQGHEVKIIDYRPDYLRNHYKLTVANPRFDKPIVRLLYLAAKYSGWKKSLARKVAFDAFDQKFIAPLVTEQCYLSADELMRNPPDADVYIAGSDQIWNTLFKNGTDPSFYLDFAKSVPHHPKLLSYAASFATSQLREGTEPFVRSRLSNFDAISVRESSGVRLLETLGFNGLLVCDPVFLIEAETWATEVAIHEVEHEQYILVYDVESSRIMRTVAKKLAKSMDLKIIYIGEHNMGYADKSYVNAAPDTFVALIKNASYVLSNSFHATAFSLIFQKNLFVVKREDGLNTRMQDILFRYGIIDCLVDAISNLDIQIDYHKVNSIMQQDISASKKWLLSQIGK